MDVFIIGAGYVGVTLGVVLSERGFRVSFVDLDEIIVSGLNNREPAFYEADLQKRFRLTFEETRTIAFSDLTTAIGTSEQRVTAKGRSFVVTLGTPLDQEKCALISPIFDVCSQISEHVSDFDITILRSTVAIGTTRRLRDKFPNLKHIAFCPERTIEGAALEELTKLPQVVSGVDAISMQRAVDLFNQLGVECIRLESPEAAEMVKLASNSYRDVTFAFSNMLANLALSFDVNIYEVISAANFRYDRNQIPTPGLVGGPCLEKDPYILSSCNRTPSPVNLLTVSRQTNELFVDLAISEIESHFGQDTRSIKILLCGLAFKGRPLTSDTRGSLAFRLLEGLRSKYYKSFTAWGLDPVVSRFDGIERVYSSTEGLKMHSFDFVVQLTNHEMFETDAFIDWVGASKSRFISFWPVDSRLATPNSLLVGGFRR